MGTSVTSPPWNTNFCNLVIVPPTAPAPLAPDGTATAYYAYITTSANVQHDIWQTFTVSSLTTPEVIVTLSCYVNSVWTYQYVTMQFVEQLTGDIITAIFDISNGVIWQTYANPNNITWDSNSIQYTITSQPGGWWFLSVSANKLTAGTVITAYITGSPTTNGIFAGTPSYSAFEIWNAQLTTGYTLYIPSSSTSYQNLITSEHNQKTNFMNVIGVLTGALGDVTVATQGLVSNFSLNTASGVQLDILGLWIGQSRIIPNVLVTGFFGFSEYSTGFPDGLQLPFGELTDPSKGGVFYNLGQAASGTTVLTDAQYLTVLKARIARNQSNGTLSAIENALQFVFNAPCAVTDNGTLSLVINVNVPVSPTDEALLTSLDILPRPAGVAIAGIVYVP